MAFLCNNLLFLVSQKIIKQKNWQFLFGITFLAFISTSCLPFSYNVRVLLDECKINQQKTWRVESKEGFLCFDMKNPKQKSLIKEQATDIIIKNNQAYINGRRCLADFLKIIPQNKEVAFCTHRFEGCLLLVHKHNKWHLINQLDIEDYLYAVLRWESWPGWPVEVNKAFAIACRSYVISRIITAEKRKRVFHIRRTNIHQTYNGLHSLDYLRQAVEQTRGIILTHNNKPIDAMFDVCCGGVIPSLMTGVNFERAPYLSRSYACNYCKPCKSYSYTHVFTCDQLEPLLLKQLPHIRKLRELKVLEKDAAGIVQKISVQGTGGSSILTGKQFYSFIEKIKSFSFSILKKGQQFYIQGKGFGHHLGICQWGARAMVEQGRSYLNILQFYYPGAVIKQLYAKREGV